MPPPTEAPPTGAQPTGAHAGPVPVAAHPEISIVIPHLNDAARLETCLASLAAQTIAPERFEVIVVDNGSHVQPKEVVDRYANARLFFETIPGPGPARNRGVSNARAPILAFTDSDCIADPGWAEAILARFAREPELGILGGDVRIFVQTPGRPTPAEAFELLYAFRQEWQITRMKFSATACLAVRCKIFAMVGPFAGIDTTEDLDWGQRAAAKGHVTHYAPEVVVHHPARRTMAALHAQWDRHTNHHFRLRAQGPGGQAKWALTGLAMAVSPLAEVPQILASDKITSTHERWMVFRGLVGIRLYRAKRMFQTLIGINVRSASARWNRD